MSFLTVSSQDNADYENWLAGGGDFSKMPQQTTMPEIHVEVVQPPPDNTLLIATGIVVPVILAIFGWWMTHRRKAPAVAEK